MKRSVVIIIAAIVCVIAVAALYLFSPIGTGRDSLNDKQVESLCSYFGESWFENASDEASPDFWNDLDTTRQTAVRIIGTEDKGELKAVYGYYYALEYLNHKGKAYEIDGEGGPFVVDVNIDGDNVRVAGDRYDGTMPLTTDDMPLRYLLQTRAYEACGASRLQKTVDNKAEEALGVPVDRNYRFDMTDTTYTIYDGQNSDEIIEEGKTEDLVR